MFGITHGNHWKSIEIYTVSSHTELGFPNTAHRFRIRFAPNLTSRTWFGVRMVGIGMEPAMVRWSENGVRLTLEHVEYRNVNSIRESQVNQHSGRVMFHVPAVLVAVVRVVPFVGRQQQLVQDVRYVPVDQLAVVFRVERDRRDDLQHKHEQLLKVHGTNGLSGWVRYEPAGWAGRKAGSGRTMISSPGWRTKCFF